jgi:hypothetical protein
MSGYAAKYELEMALFPYKLDLESARAWQSEQANDTVLVGVDGAISEAPSWAYDQGMVYVADHHTKIDDRLGTQASCKQVERIIASDNFQERARGAGHVTLAFCSYDPDVAEAARLLFADANGIFDGASREVNARHKRLTNWEDRTDRSSGNWLRARQAIAPVMRYIYEPAMNIRWRNIRQIPEITGAQSEVNRRALDYVFGIEQSVDAHEQYNTVGFLGGIALIQETGPYAVMGAMERYPLFISERNDSTGIRHVAVHSVEGRLDDNVWRALNSAELSANGSFNPADDWGGCRFAGGDPFAAGSALDLPTIAAIVRDNLDQAPRDKSAA